MFKELFENRGKQQFKNWRIEDPYGDGFEAIKAGAGYSSISLYIEDGEYCSTSTNKHGDPGGKGDCWGKDITSAILKIQKEHRLTSLSRPEFEYIFDMIKKSNKTKQPQLLSNNGFESWIEDSKS